VASAAGWAFGAALTFIVTGAVVGVHARAALLPGSKRWLHQVMYVGALASASAAVITAVAASRFWLAAVGAVMLTVLGSLAATRGGSSAHMVIALGALGAAALAVMMF
jgi:hydroxyethylthiazole kinase-like sugar kinase family protein